jgi:putative oxidoreductase
MERFFGRYSEYTYAILRIVTGFLFLWHGSQKLLGFPPMQMPAGGAAPQGISPHFAVAGTIELVGGILILVGFFASIAAFIACGEMAVAYFTAHFSVQKYLPLMNGGELAVLYCFVFLYIASRGSGVWSIDSLRGAGGKTT